MPLTASLVTFASFIEDLLNTNKSALGLGAVYYGDQTTIATTPVACVEPSLKDNNLNEAAASRRLNPTLQVVVIIYHSRVKDTQSTRKECDLFGEAVEALLNAQRTFGELVIHGWVTTFESGYITKSAQTYVACKLTVQAKTQSNLP